VQPQTLHSAAAISPLPFSTALKRSSPEEVKVDMEASMASYHWHRYSTAESYTRLMQGENPWELVDPQWTEVQLAVVEQLVGPVEEIQRA